MREITWNTEVLVLLPERAVFWPRRGALVVADLHLGKGATFRAAGVPVPEVVEADLDILDSLIDRHRPSRVVIAGDLLHAAAGRTPAVVEPLAAWRERHAGIDMVLVRGNHDLRAGDPPELVGIRAVPEPFTIEPDDPIGIGHCPEKCAGSDYPVICGHLHPSVTLSDRHSALRAPCFWVTERALVMPAFGRFTGFRDVQPRQGDRVFVVGDGEVLEARGEGPLPRRAAARRKPARRTRDARAT
jgi:DNA ligase-associated metallophosphoesterase